MPATSSAWILSTFDKETGTESSATRTSASTAAAVCFDSLGFLTLRRVYKNGGPSPAATVNDLVVRFTRDGNGNLVTEQYVGGDAGTLAPATHSCTTTLSSESYRLEHRYTRGVRERSYYSPSTGDLAFFILDRSIDANTGLMSASREASTATSGGATNDDGIETQYSYDVLGRLTDVLPQGTGRRAKTKYTYVMNPSSVTLSVIDGTTTIRSVTTSFDVLGRMLSETRTMPVGTATRSVDYDVLGRKTADRGWDLTEPTLYSYDTFGRLLTITAPDEPATTPDGTVTSFTYTGASAVDRLARIKTGAGQYTSATATEQYDTLGRLWRVTEPSISGVRTITEYTYDVGGRLSQVCGNKNLTTNTCGQIREFEYDNLGFLRRERHPEKGTSGNGDTRYGLYDSRGHVGRRYEGTEVDPKSEVRFAYDRAERLRRLYRPADDSTIKAFTYGLDNGSNNGVSDWRNGKLTQAVRFNKLPVGLTVKVFEDYKYEQPDGLVSQRTTWDAECATGCETHTTKLREFVQTFAYDKLGSPVTLGYPDCEHAGCTNSTTGRTVTNTYTAGWLSSVNWTGATNPSQITYHGTGAVNAVTHGNAVVDTQTLDAGGRTKQLTTTNAWDAAGCVAPTFTTQPQSVTVVSGQSTTLSAAASGDTSFPPSYQWYNGTPPGTASPAGSTSTSLPVSSPTQTATYWVRASNACGSADSVAATVTVCLAPGITAQPQPGNITRGQTKQLTVVASGRAQLNYQWYTLVGSTAAPINGAISATYSASPSSTTTYRVRITNDCGAIDSSSVTVTVADPPTTPASIIATKEGTGVRLQWSASTSPVGIASYRILRQPGGLSWNLNATTMLDVSSLVSGQTYVYRVSALDGNAARSEESPPDLVTYMTFDDDPLLGTQNEIRGIHVGQLRQAIDAVRAAAGLPAAWSSYGPATGDVHASDFFALRDKLNEARVLLQVPMVTFDPLHPVGGSEEITAAHVQLLRGGVQ